MADPSPGPNPGLNTNSFLLVAGSALAGALLFGGMQIRLPADTPPVVVVQAAGSSPALVVEGSLAPTASDETKTPEPTVVPVPAPRIPTFDTASAGALVVLIFGLVSVALVGGAAVAVAASRNRTSDEEVLFDARPEAIKKASLAAFSLVFVGLGVLVLVPAIEVVFDADHVRYLESPSASASSPSPAASHPSSGDPSGDASASPSESASAKPTEEVSASPTTSAEVPNEAPTPEPSG